MMPSIHGMMLGLSGSLAASIVAKGTVTTALALIGARLARRSRASVRHALLAAAFAVVLMLPVFSLLAPPLRIAVSVVKQDRTVPAPASTSVDAISPVLPADAAAGVTPAIPRSPRFSHFDLWTAAWIAGAIFSLLPVAAGLRQVYSLRRTGLPWRHGQAVVQALAREAGIHRYVEVLLHEGLPGPITCGVVHPAIMLPTDAQTWQRDELNRALVHELEHVRRGDWASQCIARTVCAVYWFHPFVWVAWRRLALEAERSCDDAVLGRSDATDYADQLVGLAQRLSLTAKTAPGKSPLLAMANRADLSTRVRAILDDRQARGKAGALVIAFAFSAAAVVVLTVSPLRMVAAPQSSPAQTAASRPARPEFDAVSVKLIDPDMKGSHSSEHSDPGRLVTTGTMHRFILRTYGITDGQLSDEPDWFKTHLYSIEAVTSAHATQDQMMLMLRNVLADRFQLKLREESRFLPVYALEVAPGGPKFKELQPGEVVKDEAAPPDVFARSFSSIAELLNTLNGLYGGRLSLDRPVVDRTHLTGNYNMRFRTDIDTQTDDLGRRSFQFPNLFHDLQSQLGLKLAPDRVRMPCFVVEKAAPPTPN